MDWRVSAAVPMWGKREVDLPTAQPRQSWFTHPSLTFTNLNPVLRLPVAGTTVLRYCTLPRRACLPSLFSSAARSGKSLDLSMRNEFR